MDGNRLIELGCKPGPHFVEMLAVATSLHENDIEETVIEEAMLEMIQEHNDMEETIRRDKAENMVFLDEKFKKPYHVFVDNGDTEFEKENMIAVHEHMAEMMRIPTIVDAAVLPDACPAGSAPGTIPVGAVAVAKNAIHPGMHSADICCSMFLTKFDIDADEVDVSDILDSVQAGSHFGPGGRKDLSMGHSAPITNRAKENRFLASVQMLKAMSDHLGTQGDGNHFFYVGKAKSDGKLVFITHHGSRKPGALLYKNGMIAAELVRREIAPDIPKHNAWIPYDTEEGKEYWEALQIIREWTKQNHTVIHDNVMRKINLDTPNIIDRFWNEHNFVFKQGEMFYHAKGSTPVFGQHAHDADIHGRTIIPLNMGEPILIVKDHPGNEFGFAPHGAGRNMSRTKFKKLNAGKTTAQIMKEQVGHIDARFYTGMPDASELPGAYKSAAQVRRQIEDYKLATIVDEILPLGSMMAGEIDKPWLKKRK